MEALPLEHPIKSSVYQTVREEARQLTRIRELDGALEGMRGCDSIQGTVIAALIWEPAWRRRSCNCPAVCSMTP